MAHRAIFTALLLAACLAGVPGGSTTAGETEGKAPAADFEQASAPAQTVTPDRALSRAELELLGRKVLIGQATLAEVRQALTDPDIGALTNTVHGLHSMAWHRGVFTLLHDLWALRESRYPELQWRQFAKPPVRLALASTLIRIEHVRNSEYVDYLRAHRYDEHEFHRAQVVVGLAFKGSVEDVGYIRAMADGDNVFVAQSAITSLGLMDRSPARDALIALQEKYGDDPRGRLIAEVLRRAYRWPPESPERPPAHANPKS